MKLISDRKYALAMLVLSGVYCVSAFSLDADFNPVNEKFYPFVLSVAMMILSVALLVLPTTQTVTWPNRKNLGKIAVTFFAILVFSLALRKVGFLISAAVLMGVCMWVFEADRKWILPVSVIVSIVFYVVFDRLLGLTLPSGLLSFF